MPLFFCPDGMFVLEMSSRNKKTLKQLREQKFQGLCKPIIGLEPMTYALRMRCSTN